VSKSLEIDFVRPLILTAIVSNAAGLLTLVGDPATFLVGSSIGMSFVEYLKTVSLGGVLSLAVIVPLLPLLMPDVWRLRRNLPPEAPVRPLERPGFAVLSLAVLGLMIGLFLFGESLPTHVVPPAVAIIAAALALLVIYRLQIEPVDAALRDVDWKTLVFLGAIFCLVQAVTNTGLLQAFSLRLSEWAGTRFTPVAFGLLGGIAVLSGFLANTPVVAASILMIKGYLVAVEVVPDAALASHFTAWPAATIPLFVSMMFGATLGGNATLIGAAANIVAAGVCSRNGKPVSFVQWLRYGVPLTIGQLLVSALYVLGLIFLTR
jgi:Na+/H+ antiporter NhaD/arsenite permease-like protein